MKYFIVGMLLTVSAVVFAEANPVRTRKPDTLNTVQPVEPTPGAFTAGEVKRAVVCSSIIEHEPTDSLTVISPTTGRVFFFTELLGMEGDTITHRWSRDNARVAEVRISVTGDRYRCHSSRSVAGKHGQWNVQVLDDDGVMIAERSFRVGSANGQTPLGQ
jgi:Protein of unknown function (DUF2914)